MPKMLLIMGLPGSGKTTFAKKISYHFKARNIPFSWFNADEVRKEYDDWDFSPEGRIRAAERMRMLVNNSETEYNIVDMVAPTPETRKLLNPDYVVWMNTIDEGRFDDTNQMFVPPTYDRVMLMLTSWCTTRDAIAVTNMVTGEYQSV